MAPPLEISIPTTTTSTTSPPFTIYNITLRLPLRSFALSKRYSDFTTFHTDLTSQTNIPPPLPLPSKSWFSNTVSNTDLRESRRQGLESYLRAINEASDARWRSSPAWRAFLNLPSLGINSTKNNENITASSARLHTAATGPGGIGAEPITDPTLWLDCYRDLKSHLHDARLHLTRRDQETTPQKQHESSARAKSSLVRAGSLITALEDGLKRIAESSNANGNGNGSGRHSLVFSGSLGDGEIRRRKDLLINARKEKEGLEDLLNAMAAKSRVDNAVASIKDKEALVGGAGAAGRKPAKSGRVLGKETERTRELDNQGVLQLQRDTMQDQDMSVEELMKIVRRQKELGIQINEELEVQNEMLRMVDEDATRLEQKIDIGKRRLGKIS
ncbi:putative SNARE complex subunit [Aspergillus varians]